MRESVKRNVKIGENFEESKTSIVKMEALISNWNILLTRTCSITRRLNSLKLKLICKQLYEPVRYQFVLQRGRVWTRWNYCVPLSHCNTTLRDILNIIWTFDCYTDTSDVLPKTGHGFKRFQCKTPTLNTQRVAKSMAVDNVPGQCTILDTSGYETTMIPHSHSLLCWAENISKKQDCRKAVYWRLVHTCSIG